MRMQDFQTQQIPHTTESMTMQNFQTQQNYVLKKMLPTSGEECCSASENAGFPDTTKTMCYTMLTSITCSVIQLAMAVEVSSHW